MILCVCVRLCVCNNITDLDASVAEDEGRVQCLGLLLSSRARTERERQRAGEREGCDMRTKCALVHLQGAPIRGTHRGCPWGVPYKRVPIGGT